MGLKRKHVDKAALTMGRLKELRDDAGLPKSIPLGAVRDVLERTGYDRDLALTALTMIPRPDWVGELLGVHPDRPVGK